jgi:hypothetical protein
MQNHAVQRRWVKAMIEILAAAMLVVVIPPHEAKSLTCSQTCPNGTRAGLTIPDDGVNRCECSCSVSTGASCRLRAVNHSLKARPGRGGTLTCKNGSSCSNQCPKNECVETSCDLKGNAVCQCFECSELDPPKPK